MPLYRDWWTGELRAPGAGWRLERASGPGEGPLAPYEARVWRREPAG